MQQLLQITFDDIKAAATLVAAIVAAIGSLAVAYYSRKSQSKIEDQKRSILENIELLKNHLERDKNYSAFKRDRIFQHLEEIYSSFSEMQTVASSVVLRLWLASNSDLETEIKFRAARIRLRLNINSLHSFQVFDEQKLRAFGFLDAELNITWDRVLGEAARRTPQFVNEFPNHKKFNETDYLKTWMELMTAIGKIESFIFSLNSLLEIPN